jgi:DNA-binding NarL/FixJ family response regulator
LGPYEGEIVEDLSTVRVLAVDDSPQWRRFVATYLMEKLAREIETAADGLEAIHKAQALQPDVIIMDIWMPVLNGLSATREIRKVAPRTGILIVSNERDPDIVQAAFAAGARGYGLKPLAAIELMTAIEVVVRGELFIGRGLTIDAVGRSGSDT